ncbi:hypothetical protein RN001_015580 [Aquatica leii]|uniref:Uncharacterized protein n=1 Tax=Aquatica leii TaxID=1421715 RepID=A0AAN7P1G4_9COLE|nr:hypothetical protein RN001_015580 [Aquatica leii]
MHRWHVYLYVRFTADPLIFNVEALVLSDNLKIAEAESISRIAQKHTDIILSKPKDANCEHILPVSTDVESCTLKKNVSPQSSSIILDSASDKSDSLFAWAKTDSKTNKDVSLSNSFQDYKISGSEYAPSDSSSSSSESSVDSNADIEKEFSTNVLSYLRNSTVATRAKKTNIVPKSNCYMYANPGSENKWMAGTNEWVNSNDFNLKAANKNIITNELEATVLSNTIKPINTTDTTFKKERFKINPENATFNVDETCKANEKKINSSELNTKKIENILPNETQSANTIINSKMTTISNFCLDDSNSEPSIYQYSSSSYVLSTTFSDHSSNYSEPDILIPNQNITPIRHIIHLDKNMVVNLNNNITLPQNNASLLNIDNYILQYLENKNNKKIKHRTICKFCKNNVTNFERH